MSLTVICPMLNEIKRVDAWMANVTQYADQIVVIDTGSEDGTIDFLCGAGTEFDIMRDYDEPEVRNQLLRMARGDWVLRLDADELLIPEDMLALKERLQYVGADFIWLPHYLFWRSPEFIRVRQYDRGILDSRHFHPNYVPILWRNSPKVHYVPGPTPGWNSRLAFGRYGKLGPRICGVYRDKPIRFHYSFVNREFGGTRRWAEIGESGIKCETYLGPHPEEFKLYK